MYAEFCIIVFKRYIAAQNGHLEIIHILATHKADVHLSRKADGCTPFYAAADKGYCEILKYLLRLKSDVNKTTYDGIWCPLNIAAHRGFLECVQTLVELKVRRKANTLLEHVPATDCCNVDGVVQLMLLLSGQANVASIKSAIPKAATAEIRDFLDAELKRQAKSKK